MKAKIIMENGVVAELRIKPIRGRKQLQEPHLSNFEKLVTLYADEIVQKWIDFFVLGKQIKPEKITRRIK